MEFITYVNVDGELKSFNFEDCEAMLIHKSGNILLLYCYKDRTNYNFFY